MADVTDNAKLEEAVVQATAAGDGAAAVEAVKAEAAEAAAVETEGAEAAVKEEVAEEAELKEEGEEEEVADEEMAKGGDAAEEGEVVGMKRRRESLEPIKLGFKTFEHGNEAVSYFQKILTCFSPNQDLNEVPAALFSSFLVPPVPSYS
jgi:hypothetical protein